MLINKIVKLVNHEDSKRDKKCEHKEQKSMHAHCREEKARNEQQIRHLKDVVKKLDKEIEVLREECDTL